MCRPGKPESHLLKAIRTGQPVLVEQMNESWRRAAAEAESEGGLEQRLAPESFLVVSLTARGRTLGALTLAHSTSGR